MLDFFALPASDIPSFGRGLVPATLAAALGALVAAPGFSGMTFVEHNPDHGAADG